MELEKETIPKPERLEADSEPEETEEESQEEKPRTTHGESFSVTDKIMGLELSWGSCVLNAEQLTQLGGSSYIWFLKNRPNGNGKTKTNYYG